MTSRKSANAPARLPGNDGTWYLKAVGVDQTATDLADVRLDTDSTSELVKVLWEADASSDDFSQWAPEGLSRTVERKRNFRWTLVATTVIAVAAVTAALIWLPTTSSRRANAIAIDYENSLSALLSDLLPAQQSLAVLTEIDADVTQFPAEIPIITALRTDSENAIALAGQPLPGAWPLSSNAPFNELLPFRDALSREGTSAEGIARRLTDVLEYRTIAAALLPVGELPDDPAGVDLNELSTRLATASADSATTLGELPDDAALVAHKSAAQEAVEEFSDWQVSYVDALRNDDTDQVELLVVEFESTRQGMTNLLNQALSQIRSEVDAEIIALATQIESTMGELAAR